MSGGRVTHAAIRAANGVGAIGVVALLAVALLLVSACSPGASATPSPGSTGVMPTPVASDADAAEEVRVSLGIYSGRPNPEWVLTAEQVAVLDAEIAMLPDASGTPPTGGLGYHGFTVTRPGSTLVAYRGTVAPPGDAARPFKQDQGRVVERLLLETGRAHMAPAEIADAERALSQ
jgi:hypothetical protein